MTDTIIFGIGSPSDNEQFGKRYNLLGGRTIDQYLAGKAIRHTKEPMLVSCHRTLERAVSYAREIEDYSGTKEETKNRTVVVLFGGMSFALPGIFSSETSTVPVIGVPAHSTTHGGGLDSATAVYNLPPGTVVGGAPIHYTDNTSLDRAVLIAERILTLGWQDVALIAPHDGYKQTAEAKKILNPKDGSKASCDSDIAGIFGISYRHQTIIKSSDRFRIALNITDSNSEIQSCDAKSELALQCRVAKAHKYRGSEYNDFANTLAELDQTKNTLYFAKPHNAALFLARVLALASDVMRKKLWEYKSDAAEDTKKKYGSMVNIADIVA